MTLATLDNLVANDNGLRVFCSHCQRCADLDIEALVRRYGPRMALPEIGKRCRCLECGERGGSVQVVGVRW